MPSTEILVAFATFAVAASITPGPNNLMLLASGTNFGFRRTVPHMLGVSIGFAVMIALVGGGLIHLFTTFPLAHAVLKIVSVTYLVFLAWKIATAAAPDGNAPHHASASPARPFGFIRAALFQWVNPKAWTMAVTAVTAYVPTSESLTALAVVAILFGVINLPAVCVWAVMGVQLRRLLDDPRRLRAFNVAAAVLLLGALYPILRGA